MEIIGRIIRDASVKTLKDERKVVNFTMVMNDYYKTKDGEKKQVATFFDCAYWISEKIAQHLTKGTIVSLYGRIGINCYKGMDGEAHGSLTFHVNNINIIGKAKTEKEPVTTEKKEDLPF